MTGDELAKVAKSFLNVTTCYLLGFWGQYCSQAEYDRVNKELARSGRSNDKYNNQKYINDGSCYPFDCINFVKGILGGCRPGNRISYARMRSNPVGDCTPEVFSDKLYDCVSPGMNVPAGYGLAKPGHAAISLGNGQWIDVSYDYSGQNGAKLHTGGVPSVYKCGKIPGVTYSDQPTPEPSDAAAFRDFLISNSSKIISEAYDAWKGGK